MEQGFDGWVRGRFQLESSDINEIASHIDPSFDWDLPTNPDDLIQLLAADLDDDQTLPEQQWYQDTTGPGPAAAVPQATAAPAATEAPPLSAWQLAYLQQAISQQETGSSMAAPLANGIQLNSSALPGAAAAAMVGMDFSNAGLAAMQPDPDIMPPQLHPSNAAAPALNPAIAGSNGALTTSSSDNSGSGKKGAVRKAAVTGIKAARGPAKPRRVTDAQRAAHKRFRDRRKEKVATLVAEVAAKQEQLQQLTAEQATLVAKARALDQLVASAGDNMLILQRLDALTLQQPQKHQEQQQLDASKSSAGPLDLAAIIADPVQHTESESRSLTCMATAAPTSTTGIAAAAAAGRAPEEPAAAPDSNTQGIDRNQQQHPRGPSGSEGCCDPQPSSYGPSALGEHTSTCDSGMAGANHDSRISSHRSASVSSSGCSCCSLSCLLSVPGANVTEASRSLARLEAAVHQALGLPSQGPIQQQLLLQSQLPVPVSEQQQLHASISSMQRLHKKLMGELMQLLLLASQEKEATGSSKQGAGAAEAELAGAPGPAALRIQQILHQVTTEFRGFAATNRISLYMLRTLNYDTGVMGVGPPPGHWARAARVLQERLEPQVLRDICVSHQLAAAALHKVSQQRQQLLHQLHVALLDTTSSSSCRFRNDSRYTDLSGSCCQAFRLLNAIDSNLRKDHVIEGCGHWAFNRLIPPVVLAEVLVYSHPYFMDSHAIVAELLPQVLPDGLPALSIEQQQQRQHQPFAPGSLLQDHSQQAAPQQAAPTAGTWRLRHQQQLLLGPPCMQQQPQQQALPPQDLYQQQSGLGQLWSSEALCLGAM